MIHRACMVVMDARPNPSLPPSQAELDESEADFLHRHVDALRKRADSPEVQLGKFTVESQMPTLLRRLLTDPRQFIRICEALTVRLRGTMTIATNPRQGVFVVVVSGPDEAPDTVSLLKLDANVEVAQWRKLTEGGVRLKIIQKALPGPGGLQKGISWPDSRPSSEVIVQDRNIVNALYFLNAFDVDVSPKASEIEKGLFREIIKLPPAEMKRALAAAATKSGPADVVASELKEEFPTLDIDKPMFGVGRVAGTVRANKFAARPAILGTSGIEIVVPIDRLDAVGEPHRVGDHWEVTVRFPTRPTWRS